MEYLDDILYAAAAFLGSLTVCILLLKSGRLPFIRGKVGNKEFEIGKTGTQTEGSAKLSDRQFEIDEAVDILVDQKYKAERRIVASQVRSIRDYSEGFDAIFAGFNPLVVGDLWNRFAWSLYLAAVENHILAHIHDGRIVQDYIDDKIYPVQQGHARFASGLDDIPYWGRVEAGIDGLMRAALDRFADIARSEWENFHASVRASLGMIGDARPGVTRRIQRLLEVE